MSACATVAYLAPVCLGAEMGGQLSVAGQANQPLEPEEGRLPLELLVKVQDAQAGARCPPHARHVDGDLVRRQARSRPRPRRRFPRGQAAVMASASA